MAGGVGVVWARGRRKVDFSLKKVGVTPNPRVKKFGVTPKSHKFVRVGQRSRGGGRPWRVNFFDSGVRGNPHFF